jgi:hypothetical protein
MFGDTFRLARRFLGISMLHTFQLEIWVKPIPESVPALLIYDVISVVVDHPEELEWYYYSPS